jgi:hypothetical protein
MNELKDIMNIKMESDLEGFDEDRIAMIENVLHCFQSQVSMQELGLKLKMNKQQEEKMGLIANIHNCEQQMKVNMFFAIKHLNKGKIDSHMYFFRGFCRDI